MEELVKDILSDKKKGIVVVWDEDKFAWTDYSSGVPGRHAAEFATTYREKVLENLGLKDFWVENLSSDEPTD